MIHRHQCIAASTKIKYMNSTEILHLLYVSDMCNSEGNLLREYAVLSWRLPLIYCPGFQDIRMCLENDISWNSHLPQKKPAVGLFRCPLNSSHYSIFCSQYWNVPNNMLFEGKLGSNLSSLCVLSRAGGRSKQGFTASHGAVISNSWQSQTKTLFLWLPHCNNTVQRTDCIQAKNQRLRNTENSSSHFFGNKTLLLPAQCNSKKT